MKTAKQIINNYQDHIQTVKDVISFFSDLKKFGLYDGFHPDTDFSNYLNQDGNDLFTDSEVNSLSKILNDCFKVCKKEKSDIYEIAQTQFASSRTKEIKKAFDNEMKKVFKLTESLEELLNKKMKIQTQDYLNWKQVDDMKNAHVLLVQVKEALERN